MFRSPHQRRCLGRSNANITPCSIALLPRMTSGLAFTPRSHLTALIDITSSGDSIYRMECEKLFTPIDG